jgi:ketosteroid isomerase-like protein
VPDLAANKAIVLAFWESSADDKGRFITDDVQWHLPTSVAVRSGFAQDLRGDDVRALFAGGQAMYQPERTWDIGHVLADDDLVALHCTMHGRTATGNDYHGSYHMLFRIEGDRIAEGWEFLDTAYVMERMGPRLDN